MTDGDDPTHTAAPHGAGLDIEVEVDPSEVGLDAGRLARIDRHFAGEVAAGRLSGWLVSVARHGRIAHVSHGGTRDLRTKEPVRTDTIWALFSMTKPITSVAALMLCEEGTVRLTDPIARYLPAWSEPRVWTGGGGTSLRTRPAVRPITIWHLLTHTSGLTYSFFGTHAVDAAYRDAGFAGGMPAGCDLAEVCDRLATLPLLFDPGDEWNYSMATDVLGRVLEVASGRSLDDLLSSLILDPLGMSETKFFVPEESVARVAALNGSDERGAAVPLDRPVPVSPPTAVSGGGGLFGTAGDYHRFMEMLRGRGAVDGVRLLGSRTVDYMATNHLPGGADIDTFGRPLEDEAAFAGMGFGLGVSVTVDPVRSRVLSNAGEYGWSGAAATTFWVDPGEDLTVQFYTQLMPPPVYMIRPALKNLVYQAFVD